MDATELLTVPGATAAALLLVRVASGFGLPGKWKRAASLVAAFAVIAVATIAAGGPLTAGVWLGVVLSGAAAGLAAAATYDTATAGFDYRVTPRE